jgi:hypothetical protein
VNCDDGEVGSFHPVTMGPTNLDTSIVASAPAGADPHSHRQAGISWLQVRHLIGVSIRINGPGLNETLARWALFLAERGHLNLICPTLPGSGASVIEQQNDDECRCRPVAATPSRAHTDGLMPTRRPHTMVP